MEHISVDDDADNDVVNNLSRFNATRLAETVFNFPLELSGALRLPLRSPERDLSPIGRITNVLKKITLNTKDVGQQSGGYFGNLANWELKEDDLDVDEFELNMSLNTKLSTCVPFTTAEAAYFYRDISKLEDGKLKALRNSLLVPPPLLKISNSGASTNEDVYDRISGDIIVMGGYRGSVLRDSITKRRAWIPLLKAGLNIKKINLLLDPDEDAQLNVRDKFYPDGMLSHVGPVDVSKKLLKRLAANPNVSVHNWGYDWRLSLDITSEELHQFIRSLYEKNGGNKITIIAHSMGGMVSHGAMVKCPEMIKGIVYAGTPFPCGNILGPLRFNDAVLLAKDILSCEVNFMMRSSFIFVPRKEIGFFRDSRTGDFICEEDGELLDFWKPQTWVKWNSNPLVAGTRWRMDRHYELSTIVSHLPVNANDDTSRIFSGISNYKGSNEHVQHLITGLKAALPRGLKITDVLPPDGVDIETERIVKNQIKSQAKLKITFNDAYNYLTETLERTDKYIDTLKYNANEKYPPMVQLFSNSVPSVKFCIVDGSEAIKRGDYYNFFYAEGDAVGYHGWLFPRIRNQTERKTEPLNSKTIPYEYAPEELQGFGYDEPWAFNIEKRVKCEGSHTALLTDLDAMAEALEAFF